MSRRVTSKSIGTIIDISTFDSDQWASEIFSDEKKNRAREFSYNNVSDDKIYFARATLSEVFQGFSVIRSPGDYRHRIARFSSSRFSSSSWFLLNCRGKKSFTSQEINRQKIFRSEPMPQNGEKKQWKQLINEERVLKYLCFTLRILCDYTNRLKLSLKWFEVNRKCRIRTTDSQSKVENWKYNKLCLWTVFFVTFYI